MLRTQPIKSVEPMLTILTYSTHENYSMQMKNIKYFIILTIQTVFLYKTNRNICNESGKYYNAD